MSRPNRGRSSSSRRTTSWSPRRHRPTCGGCSTRTGWTSSSRPPAVVRRWRFCRSSRPPCRPSGQAEDHDEHARAGDQGRLPRWPGQASEPQRVQLALGNDVEAKFLGAYLGSHYGKVALIAESTPYGETGVAEIEKVLADGGKARLVAKERYDQQATDVTAQLARIKKSGADAVAMIGLGNDTATVRQAMARLGMLDTPFLISYGAASLPYQERAKKLVDGTIMVGYAAFGGGEPKSPEAKKFAEAYKGAYGNDRYYGADQWPTPSFGGTPASTYDSVKVLLEAIKKPAPSTKPLSPRSWNRESRSRAHAAITPSPTPNTPRSPPSCSAPMPTRRPRIPRSPSNARRAKTEVLRSSRTAQGEHRCLAPNAWRY